MQVYLINLDRHTQRLARMEQQLRGVRCHRIAAVEGKTIAGPEQRDRSLPRSTENVSRYSKACALSHRVAWKEFLAGTEKFACVLEDDLHVSPDFHRFINDESWIPAGCDLVKIETNLHGVFVSREMRRCLDRSAVVLHSLHLGSAGYIVSRKGAKDLIERTEVLDMPTDWLIFGEAALHRHFPVYQLIPGLCVQGARLPGGIVIPEMQSAIQVPVQMPPPKTILTRIRAETTRPFHQMARWPERMLKQLRLRARWCEVPFA